MELETEEEDSRRLIAQEQVKVKRWEQDRGKMAKSRAQNQDAQAPGTNGAKRL
jgi:hypothetical protein